MNNEPKKRETLEVKRFTLDDVLTTIQLNTMSKKELAKQVEKLEQIALSLDHALVVTIKQLNTKVRAIDGTIQ